MGNGTPRLRAIPTICVALATCAAAAAVAYPRAEASASSSIRPTSRESALTARVNRARASHGLAPLHVDLRLVRAARSHTEAIVSSGVFRTLPMTSWKKQGRTEPSASMTTDTQGALHATSGNGASPLTAA